MDINASDLTPGVYFLTVNSGVAKETVKFIKK
ncbi:MAG: T9SS type A sorting domain-containing protein [Flavobacteriales bacterium]